METPHHEVLSAGVSSKDTVWVCVVQPGEGLHLLPGNISKELGCLVRLQSSSFSFRMREALARLTHLITRGPF
jgi:hypothetical protein